MSAAPIDNENNQFESSINKKRQYHSSHTKTQKYRQASSDFNPQKVNSVLESIHNNTPDDDDNELGNYNPKGTAVTSKHSENFQPLNPYDFPDKPISMGGQRTKTPEGMSNMNSDELVPQPVDNDSLKLQELQGNFMNEAQVRDYYRKLLPNYNHTQHDSNKYSQNDSNKYSQNDSNQPLIEKLNYMINLLEEQQDQKTGSVTEEVVLYSFLGVFIIFIVDSFTKVGKYVR